MFTTTRKKKSGAENRSTKKQRTEEDKHAAERMKKYVVDTSKPVNNSDNTGANCSNAQSVEMSGTAGCADSAGCSNLDTADNVTSMDDSAAEMGPPFDHLAQERESSDTMEYDALDLDMSQEGNIIAESEPIKLSLSDIGTFPAVIDDKTRILLVQQGPNYSYTNREESEKYKRTLTREHFYKKLPNKQQIRRKWLVYSELKRALFCFPCVLFGKESGKVSKLVQAGVGFTNWKRVSDKIPSHENNPSHQKCCVEWRQLEFGLNNGTLLDNVLQQEIETEKQKWRGILKIILDVILHLAKNNLSFRGTDERIGSPNCGNFLSLLELISHYDMNLKQHIEKDKFSTKYFSHDVQNEFIGLLGDSVRRQIIEEVKSAKYYSMMFDCTPDVSHKEEMTEIIRYVSIDENGKCCIKESFLDFIVTDKKTGEYLAAQILEKLKADDLDIADCRGQCYDNGANMKGKNKGVQARISAENNLARFTPCLAHSINLAGVHAAAVNPKMKSCFGLIQRVFVFFSASTDRWATLLKFVKIPVKPTSDTRWSAKAVSVGALCSQLPGVHEALIQLFETSHIPEVVSEAKALAKQICDFSFMVLLNLWNSVLKHVDAVNKIVQGKNVTVGDAAKHLNGLKCSLQNIRNQGFEAAVQDAEKMAETMGVDGFFEEGRPRRKPRMPGELARDEAPDLTKYRALQKDSNCAIDRILSDISKIAEELDKISADFEFLCGKNISTMSDEILTQCATNLAVKYPSDLVAEEFVFEILSFKEQAAALLPSIDKATPLDLLNFIRSRSLDDVYPNVDIALRIFLTLPVTVASAERSFSKLKLIKSYLRSSMGQERLTNLAILSIEHETAKQIDFDKVIDKFATIKARRVNI